MRFFSAAVGLVLLAGVATAQVPNPAFVPPMTDVVITKETVLGPLKSVEGKIVGAAQLGQGAAHTVTVWVNGYSTHPTHDGIWKIMIPSEGLSGVVAFQPHTLITLVRSGRTLARVTKFKALSASPDIRDLLNKGQTEVTSGGGDGGIRDLLNKPGATAETEVTSGGGDGGIRDLLNKPPQGDNEVTSGGGDGGIRDLLAKPSPGPVPTPVTSGGGDGGIRDLLNQPAGGQR